MLMESGMAFEPRFDLRMLMGRVIVHDQMQVQVRRGFLIYQFQKLDPLLIPMAVHARCNDAPLGHLQCSKKGGCAVAFVIMGHGSQSSPAKRQSRLGPVQRLNRGFLVGAQHQRVLGRVEIQPHHIDDYLDKLLVPTDFERPGQMGFQTTGLPHPVYHRFVDSQPIGQRRNAPVRGMGGLDLDGCLNDQRGYPNSLACLPATPRSVLFNPSHSLLDKPSAPSRYLAGVYSQKLSNRFVLSSRCCHQNYLGPFHQARG